MTVRKMATLAMLIILVTHTAHAATLVTPALPKGVGIGYQCGVVNTSTKDSDAVLFEIVGEAGAVISTNTFTIPAGATRSIASAGGAGLNYCRVTGISKSKARVTFCVRDSSFGCIQSTTAP